LYSLEILNDLITNKIEDIKAINEKTPIATVIIVVVNWEGDFKTNKRVVSVAVSIQFSKLYEPEILL
jgi:hypothetical protein